VVTVDQLSNRVSYGLKSSSGDWKIRHWDSSLTDAPFLPVLGCHVCSIGAGGCRYPFAAYVSLIAIADSVTERFQLYLISQVAYTNVGSADNFQSAQSAKGHSCQQNDIIVAMRRWECNSSSFVKMAITCSTSLSNMTSTERAIEFLPVGLSACR
jgi:hypothetical protein